MKTNRAPAIMSALIYAQGFLVVLALTAVYMRLPAETNTASVEQPVVASISNPVITQ